MRDESIAVDAEPIIAVDAEPIAAVTVPQSPARFLSRFLWGCVIVGTVFAGYNGVTMIQAAQSAPQQAAAAAMGCFYVVVMYVFARAFQEATGGTKD